MKLSLRCFAVLVVTFIISESIFAQCPATPPLTVQNPSFEGTPAPHVTPSPWNNCMNGQTPDTQPGSWGVNMPPTNGNTYLGLVHQVSASWQEGASEPLSGPMVAGVQYTFTMDIANSSATGGGIIPGCAECLVWGGFGMCDQASLLWSSGDITPFDVWQSYTVSFTPAQPYTWIMIQVSSLGCTDLPYILVDNISPIVPGNVYIVSSAVDQNIACPGMNNGQATVHASGQFPPFTYAWSSTPVQTDSVLSNVPAGTYSVTVTDINACTTTTSITITQPSAITLTPTEVPATCFGFSTGSAYMSYAGGTEPFTFIWNNGPTTQNDSNLFAGTYNITATDVNGCTATANAVITEPLALSVTGTVTNPTCIASGSIATTVTNGTTPYGYAWNTVPVQTTSTANNLSAGSYTVTVTDANTCSVSTSFNVAAPPGVPSVSLTPVDVVCFGQSNGSVSSTVTGGNPGYTYSWNTTPVQTSANATAVPIGTYVVTVTDALLCTATVSAIVAAPTALTASTTKTDVLCFGANTGTATVTAIGGTSGYTYNWNNTPAQTTSTATALSAINYIVTVTDANNCTATANAVINQPASALLLSEIHTDILCFGDATGSANVTATGGTPGYTYSWNTTPVQTSSFINSVIAATYSVTVIDANNCFVTVTSIISQPPSAVSVTASLSAPLCFGQPSASATATATGGTTGYNYSWNTTPVQNTQNISNIPAGSYTVTATDANSCTATSTIVVATPPTTLTVTTTPVNVLCFGDATGSVTANASGSYGNYSYNWNSNPVQTTATASQLIAGTYNVTVTDIQGCTATATDIVTQPATALSISTAKTDVLCFGDATGNATVTANGGTGAYNYAWNTAPQHTTTTATALIAGNYTVTVTDANGCTQTANAIINQPATPLAVASAITNINCNGASNGAISITSTGGTVVYAYQWSVVPSANTPNATGLPPGNYAMTVTDANSCTTVLNNLIIAEPAALSLNPVVTDVSCPGAGEGSIDANGSGGTSPLTYNWSNGNAAQVNSNLAAGNYTVTVTDNNGCTLTATNPVIELPGVTMNATVTNVLCFPLTNGAVDITASTSFPPLQYLWSNGAVTPNIASLDTGTYSITITDSHNCQADSVFHVSNDDIFSIDATPDTVTIDLGQTVNLNVTPTGSTFGSVIWTPSNGLDCSDCASPVSSALSSITYNVTGTDVNGCVATDVVHVNVIPKYIVFIPNAFTPNGDGANDFFEVFGNKEAWKQFEVNVFDRWGERVYQSNDMNFKWDGMYHGKLLNPSVFVYMVKVIYLDNYSEKLFKGSVTLIR